ncbi:MAG TPA: AAA family ATPase [Bacteroidales bacterium]|nr:AAA family ATPase [Bacteroidales bacterium]
MINRLTIRNFKSIRELTMDCRKLNIFIGEPNSGKSNIIEALCLQSQNAIGYNELNKDIFRYKTVGDLFCDFNINTPVEVNTDVTETRLSYAVNDDGSPENRFHFYPDSVFGKGNTIIIDHNGRIIDSGQNWKTNVRYYQYKRLENFSNKLMSHLSVPFGENMPSLLMANTEYKKWVSDFLKSVGLTLTLKPTENEITASKLVDGEIYSYPYSSLSETLQRIIFYTLALKSNKDCVILLDEPESNTFPLYTKILAERIALDKTNQFFVTTHNPYLLLNLIEKSPQDDINVCIADMTDYQTRITVLDSGQLSEVLDLNSDVFFNFNKLLNI